MYSQNRGLFVELHLQEKKWLLCCSYNQHINQISDHPKEIGGNTDVFSSNYHNLLVLGDFNIESTEQPMKDFRLIYDCKNIIRIKTCHNNPGTQKSIDLKMTNTPKSFQNSQEIKTGISNFHKMCLTVLKVFYTKKHILFGIKAIRNFQIKLQLIYLQNTFFSTQSQFRKLLLSKI